ncbi:putative ribonuclease H-like domain-containing protein [Tanacetum coccineum]
MCGGMGGGVAAEAEAEAMVVELECRRGGGCGCGVGGVRSRWGSLGKFVMGKGKADEGFFVGYSMVSKAMRVFNKRTRIVEENLNIRFLENTPNVTGNGPDWLFDVDSLTISMNYVPVVVGNQTNGLKDSEEDSGMNPTEVDVNGASDKDGEDDQATKSDTPVSTAGPSFTNDAPSSPVNAARTFEEHLFEKFSPFKNAFTLPDVPNMFLIDDTGFFCNAYDDEDVGAEADLNNLETTMNKVIQALKDPSWIEAMQEELLQFQLQKVWTLVNLPNGKWAIGTKWVFRNKKDKIGIIIRNKARLVAQGYTQEEGIDYDEVFDLFARIKAIRLFLAYASFMEFSVYQMYIKSSFLYGTIEGEVYVCQHPVFEDPQLPDKVYKVEKALYGLHQAPRAWYETLSTYLIENGFRRGTIDKTLFIKKDKGDILLVQVYVDNIIFGSTKKSLCDEFEVQQKENGIFISQDKYVAEILKKFDFATLKIASTPMKPNKALVKDEEADSVDVHLYRSIIGSLMYLTASRPDITFAVCSCARDSPFDLEAFSDSEYAGVSLDRKSTTGEYVAAANCCGQVLWIQNQMLDYGFNFMNTKIYIDNESTICIVKNPVFYSKTKHIEIRHHFIRDSYEKRLIQGRLMVYKCSGLLNTVGFSFHYLKKLCKLYQNCFILLVLVSVANSSINFALTISPTIYASCIEQFWNTACLKTINSEKKIHANVDGKAMVVSESSVRRDLYLNDEDGTACLTTNEIFENLALMDPSSVNALSHAPAMYPRDRAGASGISLTALYNGCDLFRGGGGDKNLLYAFHTMSLCKKLLHADSM